MIRSTLEYPFEEQGEIEEWKYSIGDKFDRGSVLGIFKSNKNGSELRLTSEYDGEIKNFIINKNNTEKLNKGDKLVVIEYCTHEVHFNRLCATCGRELNEQVETLPILHGYSHVTVSKKEAERINDIASAKLIKEKKLSLVLDLDHTLIHAVTENGLNNAPNWRNRNRKDYDIHNITVNGPMTYCIKKRPHLKEFLEQVKKNFELHIYTMGTRNYANEIAKLIDPNKELFEERILSRDDNIEGINFKTLQRLFPCDDSMVLIVDDRSDVWKKSKNLIQISPYVFFTDVNDTMHHEKSPLVMQQQQAEQERLEKERLEKEKQSEDKKEGEELKEKEGEELASAEKINKQQDDNNEINPNTTTTTTTTTTSTNINDLKPTATSDDKTIDKESFQINEEADCHLLIISERLTEIHDAFYKAKDRGEIPHVANMVRLVKKQILKDKYLVFSGVYPLGTPINKQPLRGLAEECGAIVEDDITSNTTHVIAQRKGTSKVNRAVSKGIDVVTPQWLIESSRIWQKADESDFKLDEGEPQPPQREDPDIKATLEKVAANLIDNGVMEAFDDDAEKELEDFLDESDLDSQGSSINGSANSSDYENDNDEEDENLEEAVVSSELNNNNNNSNEENVNITTNKILKKRKRESLSSNSSDSSVSSSKSINSSNSINSSISGSNNSSSSSSSSSSISSNGKINNDNNNSNNSSTNNSDNENSDNDSNSGSPNSSQENEDFDFLANELDELEE